VVAANAPNVAVTVVVPSATAVTSPVAETVATDAADVVHETVTLDITVPPESLTVAVSVAVSAREAKLTLVGETVIEEAPCVTVTEVVAVSELAVAVIVAVPSETEVTSPAEDTVATEAADVPHVTVASDIVLSFASLTVAVS
jgi:hypothetical protein